jgi:hypothetical protein
MSSKLGDFDQYTNYTDHALKQLLKSQTKNVILLLNSNSLCNKIIYKLTTDVMTELPLHKIVPTN